MFTDSAPAELVEEFAASMREFHPAGLRANSRAFAEADLREVLPQVSVPTLLLHGDRDVRAPRNVADALHAAIPGSTLVTIPGAGHACNIDAPERFSSEVRLSFAQRTRHSWNSHLRPVIVSSDAPPGRRG